MGDFYNGEVRGGIKVLGLTLRDVLVICGLLGMFATAVSWKVHTDDRMDAIERHLEYNDRRIQRVDQELDKIKELLYTPVTRVKR